MKNRLRELILKKAKKEKRKVSTVREEIREKLGISEYALYSLEKYGAGKMMEKWFKLKKYFKLNCLDKLFK